LPQRDVIGLLSQIHCEVSGDIARTLGMTVAVDLPLRCIFEDVDGSGRPGGLIQAEIPVEVLIVAAASDLEIFSGIYDLARALSFITSRSGTRYPPREVDAVHRYATEWLHILKQDATCADAVPAEPLPGGTAPLELISDMSDLKLPWMTCYSRHTNPRHGPCLGVERDLQ
jgi:hypothetical protein